MGKFESGEVITAWGALEEVNAAISAGEHQQIDWDKKPNVKVGKHSAICYVAFIIQNPQFKRWYIIKKKL